MRRKRVVRQSFPIDEVIDRKRRAREKTQLDFELVRVSRVAGEHDQGLLG